MKTEESNKIISEFMGFKCVSMPLWGYGLVDSNMYDVMKFNRYKTKDLVWLAFSKCTNYSNSWDWLMPVIKQVRKKWRDFSVSVSSEEVAYYYVPVNENLQSLDIEKTHKAVAEFIEWYNEQN